MRCVLSFIQLGFGEKEEVEGFFVLDFFYMLYSKKF